MKLKKMKRAAKNAMRASVSEQKEFIEGEGLDWKFMKTIVKQYHTSEQTISKPVIAHRGEYGLNTNDTKYHTRQGSLYFGNLAVAYHYAYHPNYPGDVVQSPRVYCSSLTIKNPFINTPKDPYLEMKDVLFNLGKSEALRIAVKFAKYIEETDNWRQNFTEECGFTSVIDYLKFTDGQDIDAGLYFTAHRFFDDVEEVENLKIMGYDGAIHGGTGESAGHVEYCIFDESQAVVRARLYKLNGLKKLNNDKEQL